MLEKTSFELIQRYIDGWKKNDLAMILSSLDENCVVVESHGPTYRGIHDIERWFGFWLAANSRISEWNILSFYFCQKEAVAFAEWHFCCISNDIQYALPGISLIRCSGRKLSFIHEYRMSRPAYPWQRASLESE